MILPFFCRDATDTLIRVDVKEPRVSIPRHRRATQLLCVYEKLSQGLYYTLRLRSGQTKTIR